MCPLGKLSEFDKGYLSAIIDGEGAMYIATGDSKEFDKPIAVTPVIHIGMTHKETIEYVAKLLCKSKIYIHTHGHNKTTYEVAVSNEDIIELLGQLRLVTKARAQKAMIEFAALSQWSREFCIRNRSRELWLHIQARKEQLMTTINKDKTRGIIDMEED